MEGGTVDNSQFNNFKMKSHIFPNHHFFILFIEVLGIITWEFWDTFLEQCFSLTSVQNFQDFNRTRESVVL